MIFSGGWTLAEVDFYWLTTCFSKKICSYEHFHWSFPAQEVYNSENISIEAFLSQKWLVLSVLR